MESRMSSKNLGAVTLRPLTCKRESAEDRAGEYPAGKIFAEPICRPKATRFCAVAQHYL
jgi:hypothetical protein